MRKLGIIVALLLTAGTLALSAGPASAAACVHIHRIVYDSPGSDTGTNESLNAEFVVLHNVCSQDVDTRQWKLRDQTGTEFVIQFQMPASSKLKIHTGRGTNQPKDKFWKLDRYVWGNSKDIATLLRPKPSGTGFSVASKCSYFDEPESASATLC